MIVPPKSINLLGPEFEIFEAHRGGGLSPSTSIDFHSKSAKRLHCENITDIQEKQVTRGPCGLASSVDDESVLIIDFCNGMSHSPSSSR
jgi:hypothetical protein